MIKKLIQISILIILGIILLTPPVFVLPNVHIQKISDYLFLIHKFLGLYAFSLIFIQMVAGSYMLWLDRYFPGKIYNIHIFIGKSAFTFAILHPIVLYSTFFIEKNLSYINPFLDGVNLIYFSFGVFAYLLLIISVLAALLKHIIGTRWIYLHRLNYLIFWLIFFHSVNLGEDTQSFFSKQVYIVYGTVVGIITVRKVLIWTNNLTKNPLKV